VARDIQRFDSPPAVRATFDRREPSSVLHLVRAGYRRLPAKQYKYEARSLTPRLAVFYNNLITIALTLKTADLPVDFLNSDGAHVYLDRGCIKIAEHAGFIAPLTDDRYGVVGVIRLSWDPAGERRAPPRRPSCLPRRSPPAGLKNK
jgi:hypothetical protein